MLTTHQNRTKCHSVFERVQWRYYALKGKNLYCVYTLRRLTTGKCPEQLNRRFPGHEGNYVTLGKVNRVLYLFFGAAVVILGPKETVKLDGLHA